MTLPNWEIRYLKIMETVAWLCAFKLLIAYEDYRYIALMIVCCAAFETLRSVVERYDRWFWKKKADELATKEKT